MKAFNLASISLAVLVTIFAAPAGAHPGQGLAVDFASGIAHPLSGLDHLLAMLAVGLWAGRLGGRARWLVPASFLMMMALGALSAAAGLAWPGAEVGVQGSLLVLGWMVWTTWRVKPVPAALAAGFFALFHGYAHGAELEAGADGLTYGLGFLAATAGLIGLGAAIARAWGERQRWFAAFGAFTFGIGVLLLATA